MDDRSGSDGEPVSGEVLVAVAARVGPVRLIDNALLQVAGSGGRES